MTADTAPVRYGETPRHDAPASPPAPVGVVARATTPARRCSPRPTTCWPREGPGALTVRRIAAAAGMSTMNVYSRFGGKDGVLDELFVDGFRRLGAHDGGRRRAATTRSRTSASAAPATASSPVRTPPTTR